MKHRIFFWITLILSAALIIAGFILPPMGIIDNSVLMAVGELGFFAVIAEIPLYLESKKDLTISKGNTTITVADVNKDTDN